MLPAELLAAKDPRSRSSKLRRLVEAARGLGYLDLGAIFPERMARAIGAAPEIRATFGGSSGAFARRDEAIGRAIARDCISYLPDDLLRKTDTASMHVGLECRAPILANSVTAAARSATIASLMPPGPGGRRKGLLREVARRHLPAEIVDRPKMGFAIPIGEWFRSDYGGMRTMLLDHLNSKEPFGPPSLGIDLNMKFVRRMLDEHLGTGPSGMVRRDHSQRLYMLLVLSVWAKWMGRGGK